MNEAQPFEAREQSPVSFVELLEEVQNLKDQLQQVDEEFDSNLKLINPSPDDYVKLLDDAGKREDELQRQFIGKLFENKDRFLRIFKTEKGSVYFELADGHCFRVKDYGSGKAGSVEFQPICEKVFFVDDTVLKLFQSRDMSKILGKILPLSEYKLGVSPLELNMVDSEDKIIFEENGNTVVFKGSRTAKGEIVEDDLTGGIHFGHQISETIK